MLCSCGPWPTALTSGVKELEQENRSLRERLDELEEKVSGRKS